uniref:Heparan sulfate 6-O-sulfotransferase HS6ST1 n=1 Tax=Rhipicephalus appendiculatus TaxID=34631 RepID=A0A131YJY3_RHIAP
MAFSPLGAVLLLQRGRGGRRQLFVSLALPHLLLLPGLEPDRTGGGSISSAIGPRSLPLQWSLLVCRCLLFVYSRTRGGGVLLVDRTARNFSDSSSSIGRQGARPPTFNVGSGVLRNTELEPRMLSRGDVVSAAAPFAAGYLAADPVYYYSIVRQFIGTSAGSTVAIDNKIEQAMDLVKSHLMFAVREEVDVLKEKITELLDRIAQLEYENNILRAGASPETLSLLAQSTQQTVVPVSQPQQTIAAVAQPVVVPAQPAVVVPAHHQQQQAPVAPVQPVAMQPAPVQAPQLVTVVQQPQQLVHQPPQQLVHQQPQQQLVHQQPQPLPSQPVPLQHQQPHLAQHQQQHLQKQPLQQPPPT